MASVTRSSAACLSWLGLAPPCPLHPSGHRCSCSLCLCGHRCSCPLCFSGHRCFCPLHPCGHRAGDVQRGSAGCQGTPGMVGTQHQAQLRTGRQGEDPIPCRYISGPCSGWLAMRYMGAVVTLWPVPASLGDSSILWGQRHPSGTQSIPGVPGSLLQRAQGWQLNAHSLLGSSLSLWVSPNPLGAGGTLGLPGEAGQGPGCLGTAGAGGGCC